MTDLRLTLKFLLLNAENLFLLFDQKVPADPHLLSELEWQKLSNSIYENKSLFKCSELARHIKLANPDVLMLCEVGGAESLANFNRLFLNDQYSCALIEGNSDRHIDVGFLIRKGLGFYFDISTNKKYPLDLCYSHEKSTGGPATPYLFSRDVAELTLFHQERSKPFALLLLTHLKSRLDPEGIDPGGFERRQAEMRALLAIYQEHEKRHQGRLPILVAGDLNGQAMRRSPDLEFAEIYQQTSLEDVCELAGLPPERRATYYQVNRSSRVDGRQIDYVFLNPAMAQHLDRSSVQVLPYLDPRGVPQDPPTHLDAKQLLPSDHYPLFFMLQDIPVSGS